ncbi:hypothetical protein BH11MYX4_BH11MYX4_48940 [soil metagenome]
MKLRAGLIVAFVLVGACTGFSSEPAPADPVTDPSAEGGADGGPIDGVGVVDSITLKVESGKKTWVINRPNEIKFTVTRGERVSGRVAVTVRGLSAASAIVPATLENGVTQGTVKFTPSADTQQGDLALTLEATLLDSSAKASANVDSFLRGAPGDLDTTFATKGVIAIPAAAVSAVAPDGRIFTFRFDQTTERYLADGRLDVGFATNGRGVIPGSPLNVPRAALVVGTSVYTLLNFAGASGSSGSILKTSLDGVKDATYGAASVGGSFRALARSASGEIAMIGVDHVPPTGALGWVNAFGENGAAADDGITERPVQLSAGAWDASGLLVVGGDRLARIATGLQHYSGANFVTIAGNISVGASVALYGIDLEGANILVSGIDKSTGAPFMAKLKPLAIGAYPGFTFQPAAVAFDTTLPTKTFLQGDGSILQVGRAKGALECAITRYAANGSPDLGFGTKGVATLPVSPCAPTNIAVQPDGRIIVDAGSLGTPAGALSTRILRAWN